VENTFQKSKKSYTNGSSTHEGEDYFNQKKLSKQIAEIVEEKNPLVSSTNILYQFMEERNHSNVPFVTIALLKSV
jgi:hypothetical protein